MENIINSKSFDEIHSFCEKYKISKYTINPDGSVDVDQTVDLSYDKTLTKFPFKFNTIKGDFWCCGSRLDNLHNSPNTIIGTFDIGNTEITSLIGLPRIIKGDLIMDDTEIKSLYVGEYDVIIDGNIDLNECTLPYQLFDAIESDDNDDEDYGNDSEIIRLIFKYQRHYEIWNINKKIDIANFHILIEEIKDGLK